MSALVGHAAPLAAWDAAIRGGAMHHAWLLAGPEGIGKARFAREAAIRLLSRAAAGGGTRTADLIAAGSHPDYRVLSRLPREADKPEAGLARSITIAQVRSLQPLFATTPSMGPARVVVIDAIDDLERGGANALLKNLEEPPAGTIFLLVSHAPGRLLPTIRSRCRLLRFEPLAEDEVAAVLRDALPEADAAEVAALAAVTEGAPGAALRYAGLDIAALDAALASIAATGDRDNAERLKLSRALATKASQARYEAFLERAPRFLARAATTRQGEALRTAIDAQAAARDLAGAAIGLSLDQQGTVLEMAGLVARLHEGRGAS